MMVFSKIPEKMIFPGFLLSEFSMGYTPANCERDLRLLTQFRNLL